MKAREFFATGLLSVALFSRAGAADSSATPGPGFSGDRYANLWTKSPFAIATPDASATSADYQLVGMAQFDGISYASLIDKQTQEHFVLASDKPVKNLTLVSISHGTSGALAVIQRNGESLTLKQEEAPAAVPASDASVPDPGRALPQANPSVGGVSLPLSKRPPVHIHRTVIVVPPRPTPQ
jgi:hypothetical protein